MTLFICTAGTSLMGGPFKKDKFDTIEQQIGAKIAADESATNGELDAFLKKVSAETKGLACADCGPRDEVLILATDTPDGRTCAARLAKLIEGKLGAAARAKEVEGLQVTSGERFRQSGIRNLIQTVLHETRTGKTAGKTVVFNVTGGFKCVVPYLTILGMFEDVEIVYVYDFSDALIRLPALPVRFDAERIAFALPALQVLSEKQIMTESDFRALLPGHGRGDDPIFAQLIEEVDGMVVLSGAGDLALAGCAPSPIAGKLLLHRRARQSTTFAETHAQRSLARITDAKLRSSIPHHCEKYGRDKTDMLVWKENSGSGPRIYYWTDEAGDVFVADILPHDEHERDFVRGNRKMWRRDYPDDGYAEYRPLSPPQSNAYGEALAEFLQHNDRERSALERRLDAVEHEFEALREQHAKTKADGTRLRRDLDDANARIVQLSDELAAADRAKVRLLAAASFAANAHRRQRRKDIDATPYVNHVIDVARILAEEGGVTDEEVLVAALLHDTIEDTAVSAWQLQEEFGKQVRQLVEELSDDKTLPKDVRKQLQIESAADASPAASLIKLGDKIANLRDLARTPPSDWSLDRRRDYLAWAKAVVAGLRASGDESQDRLRAVFDRVYLAAMEQIAPDSNDVLAQG